MLPFTIYNRCQILIFKALNFVKKTNVATSFANQYQVKQVAITAFKEVFQKLIILTCTVSQIIQDYSIFGFNNIRNG